MIKYIEYGEELSMDDGKVILTYGQKVIVSAANDSIIICCDENGNLQINTAISPEILKLMGE